MFVPVIVCVWDTEAYASLAWTLCKIKPPSNRIHIKKIIEKKRVHEETKRERKRERKNKAGSDKTVNVTVFLVSIGNAQWA